MGVPSQDIVSQTASRPAIHSARGWLLGLADISTGASAQHPDALSCPQITEAGRGGLAGGRAGAFVADVNHDMTGERRVHNHCC